MVFYIGDTHSAGRHPSQPGSGAATIKFSDSPISFMTKTPWILWSKWQVLNPFGVPLWIRDEIANHLFCPS